MAFDDNLKKPGSMARGTGFSGIKRVLQASAGSRIGEPIVGRLQAAGETARTGISTAAEKFRKETEEQKRKMEEEQKTASSTLQDIASGQLGGVEGATGAFQRRAEGKYEGPSEIKDIEKLTSRVKEAEQLGKQIKTTGGRQELLRQQFGQRGGYGAKQSALDALILGKTAGSQLTQAGSQMSRISPELSTLQRGAEETKEGMQKIADSYAEQLKDEMGAQLSKTKYNIEQRMATEKAKRDAEFSGLLEDLQKGKIRKEYSNYISDLETLPALTQQGALDYLSKTDPTLRSTIKQDEINKIAALQRLGGEFSKKYENITSPFKDLDKPEETAIKVKAEDLKKRVSDYQTRKAELEAQDPSTTTFINNINELRNEINRLEDIAKREPLSHIARTSLNKYKQELKAKETQIDSLLGSEFSEFKRYLDK